MSQTEFLETVELWSKEECQENLTEALPKLISFMQCGENVFSERNTDVFRVIVKQFVTIMSVEEVDKKLFSSISQWMQSAFNSTYEWIKNHTANDVLQSIKLALQMLCNELDCLISCVKYIISLSTKTKATNVSVLAPMILNIISVSYQHCKDSSEIYCDYLQEVKEPLQCLFQKIGSLLTNTITLINQLLVKPHDSNLLKTVSDKLIAIGTTVFELDIKLMATVWKLYVKIAVEYADFLKYELNIDATIEVLARVMLSSLEKVTPILDLNDNLSNEGEKSIQKIFRMCGFILKILIVLCENYNEYMNNSQTLLIRLILNIYTHSPPSLNAFSLPLALQHEMNQYLTVGIEPLLGHLLNNSAVFYPSFSIMTNNMSAFSQCMMLMTILDKIPKLESTICDHWMGYACKQENKTPSILALIFNILPKCHVELMIPLTVPGLSTQGKPRNLSLYEYVCTHLCSFIMSLPVRYFYILENTLLENLFSSNFWCQQLSGDVWAFLGRYSLPHLCFHHCCLLADVVSRCNETDHIHFQYIVALLNRLINFLAPDDLENFLQTYSGILRKKTISRGLLSYFKIHDSDILKAISVLQAMSKSSPIHENIVIESLQTLCATEQTAFDHHKLTALSETVVSVWKNELSNKNNNIQEELLLLTSKLIWSMANKELLRILTCLTAVRYTDATTLRVIKCLDALRRRKFADSLELEEIITLVSRLFGFILVDNCWLVTDCALEVFSNFAHDTPHPDIITNVISNNSELQDRITTYLNKTPWKLEHFVYDVSFLKLQYTVLHRRAYQIGKSTNLSSSLNNSITSDSSGEMEISHVQQEESSQQYIETLNSLEKNIATLTDISNSLSIPSWVRERLEPIRQQLDSLLKS